MIHSNWNFFSIGSFDTMNEICEKYRTFPNIQHLLGRRTPDRKIIIIFSFGLEIDSDLQLKTVNRPNFLKVEQRPTFSILCRWTDGPVNIAIWNGKCKLKRHYAMIRLYHYYHRFQFFDFNIYSDILILLFEMVNWISLFHHHSPSCSTIGLLTIEHWVIKFRIGKWNAQQI